MPPSNGTDVFPCPFCHSGALLLIGGSRLFVYYRCGECSEIWTATDTNLARNDVEHRFETAMAAVTRH